MYYKFEFEAVLIGTVVFGYKSIKKILNWIRNDEKTKIYNIPS